MNKRGFSLIDLEGVSKPLSKFVDAIRSGIGTFYEPTRIRREAAARKDALIISTHAEIEHQELLFRAGERLLFQESRRQENIEHIIRLGASQMPEDVSDEAPDPDWISQFFASSQDVSHEDLRQLWGRLLANEIAQPGTCSRRTLTVLRDLSPEEADAFQRICAVAWSDEGGAFVLLDRLGTLPWKDLDFNFVHYLMCEAAGLVYSIRATSRAVSEECSLWFHDKQHIAVPAREDANFLCISFTQTGSELLGVAAAAIDEGYYLWSLRVLQQVGVTVSSPWQAA